MSVSFDIAPIGESGATIYVYALGSDNPLSFPIYDFYSETCSPGGGGPDRDTGLRDLVIRVIADAFKQAGLLKQK